jgi:uridine kinase
VRQLVLVAEALHERRIGEIAVRIAAQPQVRLVFIAGPSSSGKTTFAKRLGIQLAASGIHSYAVSLDDYFVDRDLTPRDELGELDFENFEAIDHALFSDHMRRLLEGGVCPTTTSFLADGCVGWTCLCPRERCSSSKAFTA